MKPTINTTAAVVGISLGNNTSVCVAHPTAGILYAMSEERFINEKNTKRFPINSLIQAMKFITKGQDILFVLSHYEVANMRSTKYIDDLIPSDVVAYDFYATLSRYLARKLNLSEDEFRIIRVPHHEAHRLAGYYMSGFGTEKTKVFSITYDGFGDGICASITDCRTNEVLSIIEPRHSLGLVYQFVTGALGFKEHQHEGKITGLAAFGKPLYYDEFVEYLFSFDPGMKCFVSNYDEKDMAYFNEFNTNIHQFMEFLSLRKAVVSLVDYLKREYGATRENIAASVQYFTEKMITEWVTCILRNSLDVGVPFNIVLSGGLFANVKVNNMIFTETGAQKLFVLPPMGDEGNAIGAAIKGIITLYGETMIHKSVFGIDDLYLGRYNGALTFDAIMNMIDDKKYTIIPYTNITEVVDPVVILLDSHKIVCVSYGHSEFGPRALGNHSILYDCCDKDTNRWLNDRLNRTEFMPFAPIVASDFANDLFHGTAGLEKTLKYMTIALPVKEEFANTYHAAYHVDKTARPQVVGPFDNPFIYKLLKRYYDYTGKKALINTSFNIHNYPIIADAKVAIESFLQADLDALLLDNVLIIKK